jgi:hypothetical protein
VEGTLKPLRQIGIFGRLEAKLLQAKVAGRSKALQSFPYLGSPALLGAFRKMPFDLNSNATNFSM